MPFGQMPSLEYNGSTIVQSLTIARFVARENGLAGKDNLEAAMADMYVDCVSDVFESE
jgi:glutathione S-transferase